MPRKQRNARRPGLTYGNGHRIQLLTGHDFFGDAFGDGWQFRREEAIEAWAELREELLIDHIDKWPATRPWAWWEFEDHPPRRKAKPRPDLLENDPYGLLEEEWFESQAAYLKRHGLLTSREAAYLEAHPKRLESVCGLDSRRE